MRLQKPSEQKEDYDLDDWKEYFNDVEDVWETSWVKKEYPELVNYAKGGELNEAYVDFMKMKKLQIPKDMETQNLMKMITERWQAN